MYGVKFYGRGGEINVKLYYEGGQRDGDTDVATFKANSQGDFLAISDELQKVADKLNALREYEKRANK